MTESTASTVCVPLSKDEICFYCIFSEILKRLSKFVCLQVFFYIWWNTFVALWNGTLMVSFLTTNDCWNGECTEIPSREIFLKEISSSDKTFLLMFESSTLKLSKVSYSYSTVTNPLVVPEFVRLASGPEFVFLSAQHFSKIIKIDNLKSVADEKLWHALVRL